jgi:DNA-binding response OmpR family regulator
MTALFELLRRIFGSKEANDDRRTKNRPKVRKGTRVLIIDDSTTVVTMLRRMLEQNGYEPIEAFDGETGVELAEEREPHVIFLDIVLPGMDGFAALRKLRKAPATADVPIIMMSGNEQATEQFWAQKIGADDFMKKPFSRAEVFARLDRVMKARGS